MRLLIDRITKECNRLNILAGDKSAGLTLSTLRDILNNVSEKNLRKSLEQDIAVYRGFSTIKLPVDLPDTSTLISTTSQLIAEDSPEEQAVQYFRLMRDVDEFRQQLHKRLLRAWSDYVQQRTQALGYIPEALARIPEYESIVRKITGARKQVDRSQSELPKDEVAIQQFHTVVKALEDAFAELERECPPIVQEFVRECGADGAELASLEDSSVRDWIEENGLSGSLCIKFRRN